MQNEFWHNKIVKINDLNVTQKQRLNFKKKMNLNFDEIEIKNTNELMWNYIKNAN